MVDSFITYKIIQTNVRIENCKFQSEKLVTHNVTSPPFCVALEKGAEQQCRVKRVGSYHLEIEKEKCNN